MSPRDQLEQQLLLPLIVSMSQHLDWTAYTKHTLKVKEVAEMYDKVSHATQQVSVPGQTQAPGPAEQGGGMQVTGGRTSVPTASSSRVRPTSCIPCK